MTGIVAIVVTFRPDERVPENLARIVPQVDRVIVVDNGSSPQHLAAIRAGATERQFELIENGTNLGIASALNVGVKRALSLGCEWIVLFDQDSTIGPGFINTMMDAYSSSPVRERAAVVFPRHEDRATGRWLPFDVDENGDPMVAITSGSLIPAAVFAACGLFEDGLIIDAVDKEFCLRCRWRGYSLLYCSAAVMLHTIGAPREHKYLGLWRILATHHSAARRYYMVRNNLIVAFRYSRRYPQWCFRTVLHIAKTSFRALLVEENRWMKLRLALRGVRHAIAGRLGKLVEI